MTTPDDDAWSDPDRAVQIEDDSPEALAGAEVEFDETADDEAPEQEDFPSDPPSSAAGTANLPASDAPADGGQ